MDRCPACGGLAFYFSKMYLRCLSTVPGRLGKMSRRDPCVRWSLKQQVQHTFQAQALHSLRSKVGRHRREQLETKGVNPYPYDEAWRNGGSDG